MRALDLSLTALAALVALVCFVLGGVFVYFEIDHLAVRSDFMDSCERTRTTEQCEAEWQSLYPL